MKRTLTFLSFNFLLLTAGSIKAQDNEGGTPFSFAQQLTDNQITAVRTPSFDYTQLIALSEQRKKQGTFQLTDKLFDANYDLLNSGTWINLLNGDRLWRLKISSPGAKKMGLYYQNFYLPEGAKLFVYNENRTEAIGAFTSKNNEEATINQGIFSTDHLSGDVQIVEYYEPKNVKGLGHFSIFKIAHRFLNIEASETCQKDIMCPDGVNWQNEKKGVVRIYIVMSSSTSGTTGGYCTGSLMNNTAHDCKKYVLTAMHCTIDEDGNESAYYNLWRFYFNYEKTGCATGTSSLLKFKTGCLRRAWSDDSGGAYGSDFLLIEMTTTVFPTGVTPYFNGWTRATTTTAGGVGIHHPQGDVKKISTFTMPPSSSSWGQTIAGTHWKFVWNAGHGSTEPGSSGSPLFNNSHLVFATLTGGFSCCVTNGCGWEPGDPANGPNLYDYYGKMSFHWTSNGTTSDLQLKPWLDPTNSGVTTLTGTFSPCTATSITERLLDNYVNIYPNPSNSIFNISIELDKSNDLNIRVYDVIGQLVSDKKINNTMGGNYSIDLSSETSGIYFVEIKTNNSKVVRKINLMR